MNANWMLSGFLIIVMAFGAWALWGLRRARGEAEAWRARHEALQLELARARAQVELGAPVEKERKDLIEKARRILRSQAGTGVEDQLAQSQFFSVALEHRYDASERDCLDDE